MVITGYVVAVTGMATGDQYAICTLLERLEDKDRINPAGAGEFKHPHVGRVLHPAGSGQVSPGVGTPGADKGDYFGFKGMFQFFRVHKDKTFHHRDTEARRKTFEGKTEASIFVVYLSFPSLSVHL
jgi:hypothetical protein